MTLKPEQEGHRIVHPNVVKDDAVDALTESIAFVLGRQAMTSSHHRSVEVGDRCHER